MPGAPRFRKARPHELTALLLALAASAGVRPSRAEEAAPPAGAAPDADTEARMLAAALADLRAEVGALRDALAASGAALAKAEGEARRARWEASVAPAAEGRTIYLRACAACHGARGDGEGPSARWLDPRPRDFTRGAYKFRTTPSGKLPTDWDLLETIDRGVPGTAMPAWAGRLGPAEKRAVIAYLKTLSSRFEEEALSPAECASEADCDPGFACELGACVLAVPEPPPPGAAALERGRELFESLKCWECHGRTGEGDGPSSATLVDDRGWRIEAKDFTRGAFKGGGDARSIYRTFTTGLDGTPMPSFADAVPPAERWALVRYVQSLLRRRTLLDWLFRDEAGRHGLPEADPARGRRR